MGGGNTPDPTQVQAAQQNLALSQMLTGLGQERNARDEKAFNLVFPFAQDRLKNGLPFFNALTDYNGGTAARGNAIQRAGLLRQLQNATPSQRAQALSDFEAQGGRNFDDSLKSSLLANETAKQEGARLITGQQQIANPLGFFSGAAGANAPTIGSGALVHQDSGLTGLLGGVAGGLASAIPL
jgi:hypothetical protein